MKNWKWYDVLNKISLPVQALYCWALYFVVEWICRRSLTQTWTYMTERPLVFAYNAYMIFTTFLIVYLFRKRVFWRSVLTVFWLLLALIDCVILMNRVTPFTGPDIKNMTDGFSLLKKYMPDVAIKGIYVGLGILGFLLLIMLIRSPWFHGKRLWRINVPLVLAGVALFWGVTRLAIEKRVLSQYFGNIAFAYEDYGYPYCLATTVFNTGINQPNDYSEEQMKRIADSGKDLPVTNTEKRPNILFLQLESFMDPLEVTYLECSEDPIPNFRKLMEEYSSGYFKVPSVGAGTANTEFETITGMSLHYFGPGEYPYKSILQKSTCESIPFILKDLGYTTHAVHNNEANFYSRRTVFPRLGFDTFTSAEYMPEEDNKNPLGWIKDEILTDEIIKCMDSSEGPDYIYTISVQGHGDYPSEPVLEEPVIQVSGAPNDAMNYKWEYFVNQMYEMDIFVQELVDALDEYPEDVILVMYGDHLPTMDLTVEDVKNRYLFQTEYVIYNNFGMKKQDGNLAAYQMGAEILDRIGIHEGNVIRYHQARKNTKNYQVDLEMLQYDLLYGKKYLYGGESPYHRVAMKMGLFDVTLDRIVPGPESEHVYYLHGSNYTPSSQVKLNGDWYDTVYVNPSTLIISGTELDDFDRLSVVQRSNSSTRKALSKSYDRAVYALYNENKWKLVFDREKYDVQ